MIILASNSPRRKALLESKGIEFKVKPSNIDETAEYFLPESLPLILAEKKAKNIATKFPYSTVLAADTVVIYNDKIFNKPFNISNALDMLMTLSGKTHKVITGITILNVKNNISIKFSEISYVKFKQFNKQTAINYTKNVNVLDKAGAYAVQEYGSIIINKITGSKSNVIGLPIERTIQALKLVISD